jgi:hypothetical protein
MAKSSLSGILLSLKNRKLINKMKLNCFYRRKNVLEHSILWRIFENLQVPEAFVPLYFRFVQPIIFISRPTNGN